MKICDCCEQGRIKKARIKANDKIIYICEECDSIWERKDLTDYIDCSFSVYMGKFGLKGLWSELTDIEILE